MTGTQVADPIATYVGSQDFKMLIGGKFVDSLGGALRQVTDPSTGNELTQIPLATAEDVESATEAARAAQPAWEALGVAGRAACFERFKELIHSNRERLAMLDAIDCGNPVKAMRIDIDICDAYLDGWPAFAKSLTGDVIPASPGNLHYTAHRPYGVVGRITAFNHPVMFAITRPLPSLITGNTLVMKPSDETSLSTLALAELFDEAFPPGVVNIVTGDAATGDAIVTHPKIKRLAFTGSVPTGLIIQRRAAESGYVKHVSLELGGKNAMIVFPDVDVDEAAEGAIYGMNLDVCQGQSCGSNSRILVHAKVYDEFVNRMAAKLGAYRVGVADANALDLGLTASVWTNDLAIAHKTADALEAGYVWVNDSTRHYFGTPFGGAKNSAIGREESKDELLAFLEDKVVHTRLGDPKAALTRLLA